MGRLGEVICSLKTSVESKSLFLRTRPGARFDKDRNARVFFAQFVCGEVHVDPAAGDAHGLLDEPRSGISSGVLGSHNLFRLPYQYLLIHCSCKS